MTSAAGLDERTNTGEPRGAPSDLQPTSDLQPRTGSNQDERKHGKLIVLTPQSAPIADEAIADEMYEYENARQLPRSPRAERLTDRKPIRIQRARQGGRRRPKRLSRLSINSAVALVVLLPLIGFTGLAGLQLGELRRKNLATTKFVERLSMMRSAASFVTAVGAESASAATSIGMPVTGAPQSVQATTDRAEATLLDALSRTNVAEFKAAESIILGNVARLAILRERLMVTADPTLALVSGYKTLELPGVQILDAITADQSDPALQTKVRATQASVNAFLSEVDATVLVARWLALRSRPDSSADAARIGVERAESQREIASKQISESGLPTPFVDQPKDRRDIATALMLLELNFSNLQVTNASWAATQGGLLTATRSNLVTLADSLRRQGRQDLVDLSRRQLAIEALVFSIIGLAWTSATLLLRHGSRRLKMAERLAQDVAAGTLNPTRRDLSSEPNDAITGVERAVVELESMLRSMTGHVEALRSSAFAANDDRYLGEWRKLVDNVRSLVQEKALLTRNLELEVTRERGIASLTMTVAAGGPIATQLLQGARILRTVAPAQALVYAFEASPCEDHFVEVTEPESSLCPPLVMSPQELNEAMRSPSRIVRLVSGRDKIVGGLVVEYPAPYPDRQETESLADFAGAAAAVLTMGVRRVVAENALATVDPVTGVLQRNAFTEFVTKDMLTTGRPIAVLAIEVAFEHLFDRFGNEILDQLAFDFATRMRGFNNSIAIARLRDFRFVIAIEWNEDLDSFYDFTTSLIDEVQRPYRAIPLRTFGTRQGLGSAGQIELLTRVGICFSNGDSASPQIHIDANEMIRRAEISLADTTDSRRLVLYSAGADDSHRRSMELRQAIMDVRPGNAYLKTHFQPIVDLNTGRVAACEALARWNDPKLGFISPAEFIPLAESVGLIYQIGRYLIEEAISSYPFGAKAPVHVNVSALELGRTEFVDWLFATAEKHGLGMHQVVVEVTETSVTDDQASAAVQLRRIRAAGGSVSIDDFGIGFSSMAYLRNFPVNSIKIDKLFTNQVNLSEENKIIVAAIVKMAKAMGVTVIAEGVETVEELRTLRDLGCDYGQGWYFAKPMTASDLSERFGKSAYFDSPDFRPALL